MTIQLPMFPPARPAASPPSLAESAALAEPRLAASAKRPFWRNATPPIIEPGNFPPFYTIEIAPEVNLVFDILTTPNAGDLVILWYRAELTPPGQDQQVELYSALQDIEFAIRFTTQAAAKIIETLKAAKPIRDRKDAARARAAGLVRPRKPPGRRRSKPAPKSKAG
jgi:hypothetical protein